VAPFSAACGGGTCIPQPSTTQQLDSLADRLMYRLAYRHFADGHEALVVNHSVTAGTSTGIRWYEIRSPNATPTVFQQGTFAPDAAYRWMGSIAMDHVGDIAVGYSVSSSSINPSIRYTGRVPTEPLGSLESETPVIAGSGSQLQTLSRWGDYSAMSVDPVDDCTFWYTNEYLKANGDFNWSTWITSFKFPGCGPAATLTITTTSLPAGTVGISYSQTVTATGGITPYTWSITSGSGSLPAGLSLDPSTGAISGTPTAAGTSTFSVTATDSTPPTPQTATQALSIAVNPATLSITTTSLPSGRKGSSYTATLRETGGTQPYTWSISSGSLPTGLTLSVTGSISGTPTKLGTFTFSVQVKDATSQTAAATLSIKITQH
jgi:Putative Ig domain